MRSSPERDVEINLVVDSEKVMGHGLAWSYFYVARG